MSERPTTPGAFLYAAQWIQRYYHLHHRFPCLQEIRAHRREYLKENNPCQPKEQQ